MIDIVLPHGNEKDLVRMAKSLGISGLVFLYEKAPEKEAHGIPTYPVVFGKGVVRIQRSVGNDRKIFEAKPDMVFGLEGSGKKDALHHRRSGLDQVLLKLARANHTILALDFSALRKEPFLMLGRMAQNVRFARKFGVEVAIASFASEPYGMRAPAELASVARVMGADGRRAIGAVAGRVEDNLARKEPSHIMDGLSTQ